MNLPKKTKLQRVSRLSLATLISRFLFRKDPSFIVVRQPQQRYTPRNGELFFVPLVRRVFFSDLPQLNLFAIFINRTGLVKHTIRFDKIT